MPIYDFVCPECGHKENDVAQSYNKPHPVCLECRNVPPFPRMKKDYRNFSISNGTQKKKSIWDDDLTGAMTEYGSYQELERTAAKRGSELVKVKG